MTASNEKETLIVGVKKPINHAHLKEAVEQLYPKTSFWQRLVYLDCNEEDFSALEKLILDDWHYVKKGIEMLGMSFQVEDKSSVEENTLQYMRDIGIVVIRKIYKDENNV